MSLESPDAPRLAARGAWLHEPPAPEPRPAVRARPRRVSVVSLLFLVSIIVALVGLAVAMQTATFDVWGAFIVAPVLLLLTVPLATRAARREGNPKVGRLILFAAVLKLSVGTGARFIQTNILYRVSDATAYITAGIALAPQFRMWNFNDLGSVTATRFIEITTGMVIAVIGETSLGAYVVYSWIAFVGLCFFYEAFRIAFPEGNLARYRILLFLWPSTLFWPSSVGKDAWMMLMLGMSCLGVANLLIGRFRGFVWLSLGTIGCVVVRPHMSLIVAGAFAIALVLRRNRGTYTRLLAGPIGTFVLITGIVLASLVLFAQTQSFFKLDSLDLESAQTVLDQTTGQTAEGGSSFVAPSPTSPLGYMEGAVTVLLRPFPFELPPGLATVAGFEGVLMAGLIVVCRRGIVRIPTMMLRNAYVAFALAYTAAFIFGFSSISNFGILARERAQLFPVLFVLFALPTTPRLTRSERLQAAGNLAV